MATTSVPVNTTVSENFTPASHPTLPLVGQADYALDLMRVAARYDVVTRDGAHAAAFALALDDFASRHNLRFDDAMDDLIAWLNQRDDMTRLCAAATFGGA